VNEKSPALTVGGQAVLEGVMMRAPNAWAIAVRRPDGEIEAVRHPLPRLSSRSKLAKIPLIRGVMVLGESLTLGFRALTWSAQKAVGEDEKPLTKTQMAGSMTLAVVFFTALFLIGPAAAARALTGDSSLLFNIAEGVIRLALFLGYLWLLGRSTEIRRVFQYHGAEHMAIHAYEGGRDLSTSSVAEVPPEHPRCGTSFLLIVVVASIVLFSFLGRPDWLLLVASRILGIPVISGLSYEVLKFSGKRADQRLGRVLATPGLWLQRLTTRVPDSAQIEVAVASLLSAFDEDVVNEITGRGPLPAASVAARAR
jgi:uncharacterized protein YqhQ